LTVLYIQHQNKSKKTKGRVDWAHECTRHPVNITLSCPRQCLQLPIWNPRTIFYTCLFFISMQGVFIIDLMELENLSN
jgi:hypothetical protein